MSGRPEWALNQNEENSVREEEMMWERSSGKDFVVEIRMVVGRRSQPEFAFMGRSGGVNIVADSGIHFQLKGMFKLDDDVIEALISVAKEGFIARFYQEERRIVAEKYFDFP